jgi:Uma2 family endonuclease
MATVASKLLTAEEFRQLPDPADGTQQELIQGVVFTMPPPGGRHGECCSEINRQLANHVKQNKLGKVTSNDSGFIGERDPDSVFGPDVAFWNKDRLPEMPEGYIEIPPDLAVEVVSPNDFSSRLQKRVISFLKAGVKMIWLVDPELRIVTVYRALDQSRILEENDTLSGDEVVPGFSCKVAELFG